MVRIMSRGRPKKDNNKIFKASIRYDGSIDNILRKVMDRYDLNKSEAFTYLATYYDSTATTNSMDEHLKYLLEERIL